MEIGPARRDRRANMGMAMEETSKPTSFEHFVSIIDRLRSDGGCPWDREQTHRSLRQATLEEAYEVVHAIETGDAANLKEELGDILLHVVFHSDIARRNGDFTVDDVIASVTQKMVRRHPHVFGSVKPRPPRLFCETGRSSSAGEGGQGRR
jgi:tetrapyrrole methylase family protein/MazG family protein